MVELLRGDAVVLRDFSADAVVLDSKILSGGCLPVQLITSSTKLSNVFRKLLDSCTTVHLAVAWASVGFSEYDALVKAKRKIGRVVIGTHFYQTAPEFIAKFSNDERVRFVMDHSGVFHPKLYLFERKGGGWTCIVGSANFTAGGFGRNQEACLLVTEADDPGGTILANARGSVDRYWKDAVPGANVDLDRYREMRKRLARPLAHAAGQFGKGKPGRAVEDVDVLNMSWDEFLASVRGDRHHALDKRLDVLDAARGLFQKYESFAEMPIEDRQGIAGFREDGDVPWGWFGSMRGAGVFKNIVNQSPSGLSDALDQVPLDGRVTRDDYLEFVDRFVRAFPIKDGKPTRHGLGTATRLLAMKRPDYFVCLDGANRRRLLDDFDINVVLHDYDGYWDKIVERLKLATWWNSRRPREKIAGRVWDGRAAMLDAIYYAPKV
jgi:HKD family nuclease